MQLKSDLKALPWHMFLCMLTAIYKKKSLSHLQSKISYPS